MSTQGADLHPHPVGLAGWIWFRLPFFVRAFLDRDGWLQEFLWFGIKQAWACVFGAALLFGILVTKYWYPSDWIPRYDFLFWYALCIQAVLLLTRMETWREFCVVILFHILATVMELFKTSGTIGSWSYPGEASIRIAGVPLFAGFLYSAVGSYIARIWRIFHMDFQSFPRPWLAALLAVLAYLNFFTHHYFWDLRWVLIAAVGVAYWKTKVFFQPAKQRRDMSLLVGFVLVTFFLWLAENLGTLTTTWIYPDQAEGWKPVGWGKFTSWFLLMQLSFVLIYLLRLLETRLQGRKNSSATG